jgi:chromate reductase
MSTLTTVGLSGSLRHGSFNAALLRAALELAPSEVRVEVGTIRGIPLFDEDVEREGLPEAVTALKEQIARAGGLLLATPEYNHGIPGVMKNAIDWLSRPRSDIPRIFGRRPVAVVGASPSPGGSRAALAAWFPILQTLGARTFEKSVSVRWCYTGNAGGQAKPCNTLNNIGVFQQAPTAQHYLHNTTGA